MHKPAWERRRRFVYITRNTEYHLFDRVCVAVRDVGRNRWLNTHSALNREVAGAIKVFANGAVIPKGDLPDVGEGLFFALGEPERQLVTSPVRDIRRPGLDELDQYPENTPHAAL